MKITFLGTGTSQGIPIIACSCDVCKSSDQKDKRLRSSIMIEVDNKTIVIDCGPDFRYQMLRENVKQLDGIFITHGHRDHIAGIDDIRPFNYTLQKPIDIFAKKNVLKNIKEEYTYIFKSEKYPGVPKINLHLIDKQPFDFYGISIIPIEVKHFKTHILGFRIGDFTYITDANYISPEEKHKIKGTKILVLNALRKQPHFTHFTLDQALSIFNELKPEQGYITHISQEMGFHSDVEKELPANIHLAYDGLKLEI